MATTLKRARDIGAAHLVRYGEEVERFLRSAGVRGVSAKRIYIDPNGLVSFRGKIVRQKSGQLVLPDGAQLTEQGRRTAELAQSAGNVELQKLVGKSHTVTSREQLAERRERIRKAKAQRPPPPPKPPPTPKPAPSVSAKRIARPRLPRLPLSEPSAAPAPSRPIPSARPKPPAPAPAAPKPTAAAPRPERAGAPTPAPVRFVPVRAAATVIDGVTVLLLQE